MYRFAGGVFGEEAKKGQLEYRAFRRQFSLAHPRAPREALSAAWAAHKLQRAGVAQYMEAIQPEPARVSAQALEDSLLELETDPRSLNKELLYMSQHSPNCYPYGLAPDELRDLAKLKAAVRRARRQASS